MYNTGRVAISYSSKLKQQTHTHNALVYINAYLIITLGPITIGGLSTITNHIHFDICISFFRYGYIYMDFSFPGHWKPHVV